MDIEKFINENTMLNEMPAQLFNKSRLIQLLEKYAQALQLQQTGVIPRLFFVVARTTEENWEQITNGLDTYEKAKEYMNNSFCKKKYPYAFIVASLNEV
jgi:hypothetical protein